MPEIYLSLTSTLHRLAKDYTPEERQELGAVILDFMAQIKRAEASGVTPAQCSAFLHEFAERFMAEAKAKSPVASEIRCGEACAFCCHISVAITGAEAAELIEVARDRCVPLDEAKLRRQAGHTDEGWLSQPVEDRACVFLGADNRCRVYEHRPLSCRKYFSVAPPELCNVERYPKEEVPIWFDPWTEALTSAAMTHFGSGDLPQMLLQALTQHTKETPP
jgi:Predicted Fe-S-cluster oxidoreductase